MLKTCNLLSTKQVLYTVNPSPKEPTNERGELLRGLSVQHDNKLCSVHLITVGEESTGKRYISRPAHLPHLLTIHSTTHHLHPTVVLHVGWVMASIGIVMLGTRPVVCPAGKRLSTGNKTKCTLCLTRVTHSLL